MQVKFTQTFNPDLFMHTLKLKNDNDLITKKGLPFHENERRASRLCFSAMQERERISSFLFKIEERQRDVIRKQIG